MGKRLGRNDVIFLLGIVIVGVVLLFVFYGTHNDKGDKIVVTVDGQEFGTYSLSEDMEVEITDSKGKITNLLKISSGQADMIDADCPDKLCVKQKSINLDKETIVCLPNKVVVTVTSSEESDIDAVAN